MQPRLRTSESGRTSEARHRILPRARNGAASFSGRGKSVIDARAPPADWPCDMSRKACHVKAGNLVVGDFNRDIGHWRSSCMARSPQAFNCRAFLALIKARTGSGPQMPEGATRVANGSVNLLAEKQTLLRSPSGQGPTKSPIVCLASDNRHCCLKQIARNPSP
jgi:hypothetical protein